MLSIVRLVRACALAGTLAAPGCTGIPSVAPTAPIPVAAPVPDSRWELTASSFIDTGRIPGLRRATLIFRDGQLAAFSGCNSAAGTVRDIEGRLDVAAFVATLKACPEPLKTFESRYFTLLRSRPIFRIDTDTFAMHEGDQSAQFRRTTAEPGAATP
jgi:heat shock protein HslJ